MWLEKASKFHETVALDKINEVKVVGEIASFEIKDKEGKAKKVSTVDSKKKVSLVWHYKFDLLIAKDLRLEHFCNKNYSSKEACIQALKDEIVEIKNNFGGNL